MGRGKGRSATRFYPWATFFFLLYINDLTKVPSKGANIFLYADDRSIIVTNAEYNGYKLIMNRSSTGNIPEFLCWKWKLYPRVVSRKSRLV
jgi:hypothetical protein